jgi:hypothetical protein
MQFWRQIWFTLCTTPARSGQFRSWLLVALIALAGSLTKSALPEAQQAAVDAPVIAHDERASAARLDRPAKKRNVGPLEGSGSLLQWRYAKPNDATHGTFFPNSANAASVCPICILEHGEQSRPICGFERGS